MPYQTKLSIPITEVTDLVREEYGLNVEVVEVRPGCFSTIVFLISGDARFVLKCFRTEETDVAQLTYAAELNLYLADKDVPVARWRATENGQGLFASGTNLFQMWELVPGTPFRQGDMSQLREAGSALGRFHQATDSYPESKLATGDSYWESEQKRMEATWCDVLEAEGPTHLVDSLREHLAELRPYRDDLEAQPNCIMHGDFRAQNMVYEGNRLAAILDLDSARRAPKIYDLAYALAFFQAVLSPRPLSKVEMTQFSRAYSGKMELTDHEKLLMPKAMGFCFLKGVSLWLGVAYVSRMNRDSVLAWIDSYLPLLAWLDENGELVF